MYVLFPTLYIFGHLIENYEKYTTGNSKETEFNDSSKELYLW
jgi:hypothetical protein